MGKILEVLIALSVVATLVEFYFYRVSLSYLEQHEGDLNIPRLPVPMESTSLATLYRKQRQQRQQQSQPKKPPEASKRKKLSSPTMKTTTSTFRSSGGRTHNSRTGPVKTTAPNKTTVIRRPGTLSCSKYGGPSDKEAAEMVYWWDIPSDAKFISPFKKLGHDTKYILFQPDLGGWNNVRLAMESSIVLAMAMGRTMVLPPNQEGMFLMGDVHFHDLVNLDIVQAEHPGLSIITFQEFLEREAMTGQIVDDQGNPQFPPFNRTDWNGHSREGENSTGWMIWEWLKPLALTVSWNNDECVAAFAAGPSPDVVDRMFSYLYQILEEDEKRKVEAKQEPWQHRVLSYDGRPTPVDASPVDRLRELLVDRRSMCVYESGLQQAKIVHIEDRVLVHFYAFLFFEDWRQDLWTKRFVRDHLRYMDELQCAAARVVAQVRKVAKKNGDPQGLFDSVHVRREDFLEQFPLTAISSEEYYENNIKDMLLEGRTVYVATDERNRSYFDPMVDHYHLVYLDDFAEQLKGVKSMYYGIIDQLVASRGDVFVGTYFSTFSGYINRIRGYHAMNDDPKRNSNGAINSYYYQTDTWPDGTTMFNYVSVVRPFWSQEFPVSWRDIDHDLRVQEEELRK